MSILENHEDIYETQLKPIHDSLEFHPNKSQLTRELPEQIMAITHIKPDDCVLELGGSIGRNSCVINTILNNKTHHAVIEPSPKEIITLARNRDVNNLRFHIENSAISTIPLYSRGWYTYPTQIPGSTKINTLSYSEFKSKYNLPFNVLVIDNEGNFPKMLSDTPEILNGIRLLIIEHDFHTQNHYDFFKNTLNNKGFTLKTKFLKETKYAPGMNWADGLNTDPIFVSAWERDL